MDKSLIKSKIENQELSLLAFSNKDKSLETLPSKVSIRMANYSNWQSISIETFEKIAMSTFDNAYYVELQGFPDFHMGSTASTIIEMLARYKFVNFLVTTWFSFQDMKVWKKLIALNPTVSCYIESYSKNEDNEYPEDRQLTPQKVQFMRKIQRVIKETGDGDLNLIVNVRSKTLPSLPQILDAALELEVSEVRLNTLAIKSLEKDFLGVDMIEIDNQLATIVRERVGLFAEKHIRLTFDDKSFFESLSFVTVANAQASFSRRKLSFPLIR